MLRSFCWAPKRMTQARISRKSFRQRGPARSPLFLGEVGPGICDKFRPMASLSLQMGLARLPSTLSASHDA